LLLWNILLTASLAVCMIGSWNSAIKLKYLKFTAFQCNLLQGTFLLHAHTLASKVLPCLEALMASLLWCGVQARCHIALDVWALQNVDPEAQFLVF
jgi:hypothetical protein